MYEAEKYSQTCLMWCEDEPDEYEEDDAECYIFWYYRALLTLTASVQSSVFAFLTGKCLDNLEPEN